MFVDELQPTALPRLDDAVISPLTTPGLEGVQTTPTYAIVPETIIRFPKKIITMRNMSPDVGKSRHFPPKFSHFTQVWRDRHMSGSTLSSRRLGSSTKLCHSDPKD